VEASVIDVSLTPTNAADAFRWSSDEALLNNSPVDCKFCEIVEGRREATIVYEDDRTLGFLDHRPLFPGHSLLVPREHYETLPDLPPDLGAALLQSVQLVARAMEEGLGAEGSFVAVNNRVSQSVPHVHVHVVPRRYKDGLRGFFWPRHGYRDEGHAETTAEALRDALARLSPNG
jgi:histidine triad (HIT) family protein